MTLAASVALVAGCAGSDYGREAAIPVGSEVVVKQRLALGAGNARVYIQNGAIASQGVDRYQVACYIRIQRRGEEPLVEAIRPGRFLVIEGSRSWAELAGREIHDTRVAAIGFGRGFPFDRQRRDHHTAVEIRSDRQSQVDELRCRYNGWRSSEAPEWAGIQKTLGELATLKRPDAPR